MPTFTPQQLKRALIDAGFVVFRTLPDEVVVAERVRENLIMDSGIRLRSVPALGVRIVLRIQRGHFPGEDDAKLFERARALASPALAHGFAEVAQQMSRVNDPGDSSKMLDTFYEVVVCRDSATLEAALEDVRFAFRLERVAHTDH
jgi:hypothetical protein